MVNQLIDFIWNYKGSQIAKTSLKKKNKMEGLTLPNVKTYYKTIVIKTVWCWHKDRHLDQRNQTGNSGSNHPSQPTDFSCGCLDHSMGTEESLQVVMLGQWIVTCRSMNLDPNLTAHIKFNSKSINNLNIRAKTIKTLEDNRGKYSWAGCGNGFLDTTTKVWARKKKDKDNLDCV